MQTRISYWPNGYADRSGPATIVLDGFLTRDEAQKCLRLRGPAWASVTVISASQAGMRMAPPQFTEEYCRMMGNGTRN